MNVPPLTVFPQIPAIAFEKLDKESKSSRERAGLTIVVSPLIALMKDQTDALKRKGIAAECSDSTKSYEEHQAMHAEIRADRLRLLYCSPEKLNNEGFVETVKHVPGGIRLVAVDEAHCISEWGHSFRPDYLKVARFVDEVKAERVVCLTATATPRVADDICTAFSVAKSNVYRTSPYRPNLHLEAEAVETKDDKFPRLFQFLRKYPGSTLVYVTLQRQAEVLAEDLVKQGFDAIAFHAGMRTEQKMDVQDRFMASKVRIVVATIAFGMGIDKADIRNIVHWDVSGTIEEYSQQIGRAGRDGLPSRCMLYICHDDFYLKENFARGDLPSRRSLSALLGDVFRRETTRTRDGEVIKASNHELSQTYDVRASPLSILFATLELRHGLLRAITPEYTTYLFEDKGRYTGAAANDKSPEAQAILKHAKKAKKWYNFDINDAVSGGKLLRSDVIRKLNSWHDQGIIFLKASGVSNRYRVLQKLPTAEAPLNKLVDDLYAGMESREEDALRHAQEMVDLITAPKCFALSLAEHFGMGLPEGRSSCGHCTFCQTKKPVVLPPKPPPYVDVAGIEAVLEACDVRDDPRLLARVAFGIKSPRVTQRKLDKNRVFGSLANHDFKVGTSS